MRAAVVGTGWGEVHVSALRDAGADVVALAGRDGARTGDASTRLGVPRAVTDLAELHALDLDLVSVATPAPTHRDVVAACPDVPVLCEKPAVGLSAALPVPAGRRSPVWVNYAFAWLSCAEQATRAVDDIGPVQRAQVRCLVDLPLPVGLPEWFVEVVTHPWSWLVTLLGEPSPDPGRRNAGPRDEAPDAVSDAGDSLTIRVRCAAVPVDLTVVSAPGRRGIRHEVSVSGADGQVAVSGQFRIGQDWSFGPATRTSPSGTHELGPVETGPPDPWYRANARSVAAAVAAVATGTADARLLTWSRALSIDTTTQAALSR